MLTAPSTFGDIARVGPIRRQAHKVRDMLADPQRTGYVAVALPEEMPVAETLELGGRLHDAVGLGLDMIVVNGLYPDRFRAKDADALRAAAADSLPPDARAAVQAALAEHGRARSQRGAPAAAAARVRRARPHAPVPVRRGPRAPRVPHARAEAGSVLDIGK